MGVFALLLSKSKASKCIIQIKMQNDQIGIREQRKHELHRARKTWSEKSITAHHITLRASMGFLHNVPTDCTYMENPNIALKRWRKLLASERAIMHKLMKKR